MPLVEIAEIEPLLVCPHCLGQLVRTDRDFRCRNETCPCAAEAMPMVGQHPVLVDFESSVLNRESVVKSGGASLIRRSARSGIATAIKKVLLPTNSVARRNIDRLIQAVRPQAPNPRVLVVGGGAIGSGISELYSTAEVRLVGFDVYASPNTQIIADGHQIPFQSGCFDAVVVQAVLEHVIDPYRVVREIHRVLKPEGLVYAETPFMQHVHEGPYDFHRFTLTGHRALFRAFAELDSGPVQGAGTQLLWSLDHLARSLFRSHRAGMLCKLMFFWVGFLDQICSPKFTIDCAPGFFFLGRRAESDISAQQVVNAYRGAQ